MKKTLRLTVDYVIDIKESVKLREDSGEYRREIVEKTQHILDALFLNPDLLYEWLKFFLYLDLVNNDFMGKKLEKFLGIHTEREILTGLKNSLPPGTVSYCLGIFDCEENYPEFLGEDEGRNLLVTHFSDLIPIRASIEEIGKDGRPVLYREGKVPLGTGNAGRVGDWFKGIDTSKKNINLNRKEV